MSQENLEIARQFYPSPLDLAATLTRPEMLEAVRAALEPLVRSDFETVLDPNSRRLLGVPDSGPPTSSRHGLTGIEGFVSGFRDWLSEWETWKVTPTEFMGVDAQRVFVGLELVGRSKGQQIEVATHGANVLTFADGRIARLELFLRRADALKAVGLSD